MKIPKLKVQITKMKEKRFMEPGVRVQVTGIRIMNRLQ